MHPMKRQRLQTLILFLIIAGTQSSFLGADEHYEGDDIYLHEHDGVLHDLTLARIDFESDPVINPASQLYGRWELSNFESTDGEMLALVHGGQFRVWLDVAENVLRVSLEVAATQRNYSDPPQNFLLDGNGQIVMENHMFAAALKDGGLILTMVAADHAYRYTFIR